MEHTTDIRLLNEKIEKESAFVDLVRQEINKVIVGQRHLTDSLLIGLLSNGHILLEGVPGLAKTLAIKTLASIIDTKFSRIQFTPDLLPADLIGTMIYSQKREEFVVRKGPVFANFILADEINRSPAKVQSALLEAMQERQVTIGDSTYRLDEPFMVLATQNPIEQEGTYPLPEAQIDRFMLKIKVGYPTEAEEKEIMQRSYMDVSEDVKAVIEPEKLSQASQTMKSIHMEDKLMDYIVRITNATRRPKDFGLKVGPLISYGASPRASIWLGLASKAYAFLMGRGYVIPQDIKTMAPDVLRHRIILSYEAEAEGKSTDEIIEAVLERIEVP